MIPEVLAPAGNFESVIAAVNSGADAVYLGQNNFNARQRANNFNKQQLLEAVAYCRVRGVKVYQTLNTLVFDNEIDSLVDNINTACEVGIDALIVADLGVASIVKQIAPTMPIHASTQLTVHSINGAKFAKEFGFKRIVLARELSLNEINDIIKKVPIETEVFVHGALCMGISGQCYLSAMIGTKSGNRGNCAGPCRLPFDNGINKHCLSLKDLSAINEIKRLIGIGVCSFKIEGRMKRSEYVSIATKAVKNAVLSKPVDYKSLNSIFSRSGFTNGYIENKITSNMLGVRTKEDVEASSNDLLSKTQYDYSKQSKLIGINISFLAKNSTPIKLQISDGKNIVEVFTSSAQIAHSSETTKNQIEQGLLKLGDTPYFANKINIELDCDLFISASSVNSLRREAIDLLTQKRAEAPPKLTKPLNLPLDHIKHTNKTIRARFEAFSQIPFELIENFEYIYLPSNEILDNINSLRKYSEKLIAEPNPYMFDDEENQVTLLQRLKDLDVKRLCANNVAHIQIGNNLGFEIFGGSNLNITNSYSINTLQAFSINDFVASIELKILQAKNLKTTAKIGIVTYSKLPLISTRFCLKGTNKGMSCKSCSKKFKIKDRTNRIFEVICNSKYCRLLNSVPLYICDRKDDISNFDFSLLYFTNESKQFCISIINDSLKGLPIEKFTTGLYYRGVK